MAKRSKFTSSPKAMPMAMPKKPMMSQQGALQAAYNKAKRKGTLGIGYGG